MVFQDLLYTPSYLFWWQTLPSLQISFVLCLKHSKPLGMVGAELLVDLGRWLRFWRMRVEYSGIKQSIGGDILPVK